MRHPLPSRSRASLVLAATAFAVTAFAAPAAAQDDATVAAARASVDDALAFLAAEQLVDGSWSGPGAPHDVGLTGLALLAFLGDGHTPTAGPYKRVVAGGLEWLEAQQDPDTGLLGEAVTHEFLYSHAIATQALCEAQRLAPSDALEASAQSALHYVFRARNPYGAWRYDVPPIGDNDTSITGWMVRAICAGDRAGLLVDEAAYEGALSWIEEVTDPGTGRIGYDSRGSLSSRTLDNADFPREANEAMTASGLLSRLMIARDHGGEDPREHALFERQVALVAGNRPRHAPDELTVDHYAWLHASQALWLADAQAFAGWYEALVHAARESQRRDGAAAGSFDPVGTWGYAGGRMYATASMALALESPWRLEPLEQEEPPQVAPVAWRSPAVALEHGLAWLARTQRGDGSWDADAHGGQAPHDVGVTALATLALVRGGSAIGAGPHADRVERATLWLLAQQDLETGQVGPRDAHTWMYEHALATQALCEVYAADGGALVRRACERAVAFCERARNPYSGWRYDEPPIGDVDTSVTSWMVSALGAARRAGIEVDDAAFHGALAWIDEATDPESGRVGYDAPGTLSSRVVGENEGFPRERGEAMTAAGLATRLEVATALDGRATTERVEQHLERLLRTPPTWDAEGGGVDMVYWYWGTEALAQLEGAAWEVWRSRLQDAVVGTQRAPGDGDDAGSWDPAGAWGFAGGRVYATALLSLCCARSGEGGEAGADGEVEFAATPAAPAGAAPTPAAVTAARAAAHDWLVSQQLASGAWTVLEGQPQHQVGVTALALVALIDGGSTRDHGPHREAVTRGLRWLSLQQDPDTGLIGEPVTHTVHYDHALATLALCREMAAGDGFEHADTAERAVAYIQRARNPYGAWRYDEPPIGDNDTSVTSWMVAALDAAQKAGLEVDERAFQGALSWVDEVTDPVTGRVGYDSFATLSSRTVANEHFPREGKEAMTAAGIAIRRRAGEDPAEAIVERQADLLRRHLPEWRPGDFGVDMYFWLHGTDAMRGLGAGYWDVWSDSVQRAALAGQVAGGELRGSWDPIGPWGYAGGRVYATALMALALGE